MAEVEHKGSHHKKKTEGVWILNMDYDPERMFHNHPFFYNYST